MIRSFRLSAPLCVAALAILTACGDGPSQPEPVRTILLSPDTAYVRINTSLQLQASARSASDKVLSSVTFNWSSSDTTVATVSATGLVTAKGYGDASVTAVADGVTGRSFVRVTGAPGLRVVSGDAVTDTIMAILSAPLVVEVRDSRGLPLPGVTVEFASTGEQVTEHGYTFEVPHLQLSKIGGGMAGSVLTETSDALGRAAVRVRYGPRAATAGVVLSVPTLSYSDTARYTIEPGNPARILTAPKDTAVYASRSYTLRAAVVDRFGNPRTDPVTYRVASGPVTVPSGTGTVNASVVGRGVMVAEAHNLADTSYVSVVPSGTFAAIQGHDWSNDNALVVVNLDGSELRTVRSGRVYRPSWSPSSDHIAFDQGYGGHIQITDLAGNAKPLLSTGASGHEVNWPRYSRDGQWVFYSVDHKIWRARPDGSGAEQITSADQWEAEGRATPSPDGQSITHFRGHGGEVAIRVRNLVTGTERTVAYPGHAPTWSPVSDWIVFTGVEHYDNGSLRLVRADGTGERHLVPSGQWYEFGADFSPDGKWVIARSRTEGRLQLVEVESGLILPLPFTSAMTTPAWRP